MKTQLYIPSKCKVGFNTRQDTYTGKLGYVIYHDGKVWRKEASWEGWRERLMDEELYEKEKTKQYADREAQYKRSNYTEEQIKNYLGTYENFRPNLGRVSKDPTIEPVEFENKPTEGFVLNKKAGGYDTGWNHRATYCRIYDPRGFEFEITIPNLLFILQETNSYKGKGLEGEFVYAWEGKDLVLLPAHCEEYKQSQVYTKEQSGKVSAKELVPGCMYKTKKGEQLTYLGKFNWYTMEYLTGQKYKVKSSRIDKYQIFVDEKHNKSYGSKYRFLTSTSSLTSKVSDVISPEYSALVEEFTKQRHASKPISLEATENKIIGTPPEKQGSTFNYPGYYYLPYGTNTWRRISIYAKYEYQRTKVLASNGNYYQKDGEYTFSEMYISYNETISFKDGRIVSDTTSHGSETMSLGKVNSLGLTDLVVTLENGEKINYDNY